MTGRQVLVVAWGLVALVFAGLFLDSYLLRAKDEFAGSVWTDGFARFFFGGLCAALGTAATVWGLRGRAAGAILIAAALALGATALLAVAAAGMGGGHTSTAVRPSLAIPLISAIFMFPVVAIATLIVGVNEMRGGRDQAPAAPSD